MVDVDTVTEILREINIRLKRIEYATIPPAKVPPEEAEELNEVFIDALSGKTRNWRDVDRELEGGARQKS